jgi:putative heme iron utilization protein
MSNPPRHQPPKGASRPRQELLYDPAIPTPSHAEQAKTMVQTRPSATLSTLDAEGHPYGSLVLFALHEGDVILLVSELAEHTKNLRRDARASLLVAEAGPDNPLALGRITLVGTARVTEGDEREAVRATFLAKHEAARFYADFGDFSFWRIAVDRARWIGGFGPMSWLALTSWKDAEADPIAPHARRILEHMNEDHADALVLYCRAFSRATEVASATMTGVDRYGFEMQAETPDGPRPIRVAYPEEATTPDAVRVQVVALVRQARQLLAGPA